jgi:hypothetical protein
MAAQDTSYSSRYSFAPVPRDPRAFALQRALALGRATLNHFMGRLAPCFFEDSALGVLDPRVLVSGIRLHLPSRPDIAS